jgi:hypothetical protein
MNLIYVKFLSIGIGFYDVNKCFVRGTLLLACESSLDSQHHTLRPSGLDNPDEGHYIH